MFQYKSPRPFCFSIECTSPRQLCFSIECTSPRQLCFSTECTSQRQLHFSIECMFPRQLCFSIECTSPRQLCFSIECTSPRQLCFSTECTSPRQLYFFIECMFPRPLCFSIECTSQRLLCFSIKCTSSRPLYFSIECTSHDHSVSHRMKGTTTGCEVLSQNRLRLILHCRLTILIRIKGHLVWLGLWASCSLETVTKSKGDYLTICRGSQHKQPYMVRVKHFNFLSMVIANNSNNTWCVCVYGPPWL